MNKWQIICPLVASLLAAIVVGSIHLRGEHRALVSAVNHQVDGHSPQMVSIVCFRLHLVAGTVLPSPDRLNHVVHGGGSDGDACRVL
jgi:hypothetical protein